MKKVLKFIGCITLLLIAIVLSSCDQIQRKSDAPPELTVEEYLDPVMISVDEVLSLQTKLLEDNTFCNIPQDELRNVATVCLKRSGSVTKRDIVYEYIANQAIYDNLPPGQPAQEATENRPDLQSVPTAEIKVDAISTTNVPPPTTTTRTEDDTINGVPLKVTIKEERTYEKK